MACDTTGRADEGNPAARAFTIDPAAAPGPGWAGAVPAPSSGTDGILARAMAAVPYLGVVVVDTRLRYRMVLGGAVPEHGYDPAALIGRTVAEVVPVTASARIESLFRRALAGETATERAEAAEAATVYETTYGPVVEGGVVTGAVAVIRDVTVEHRALAELVASDERQRMLISTIRDVVALTSAEGRVVWVSPSVEAMLGWQPAELVGRSLFDFVHPDDRQHILVRRGALLADATPRERSTIVAYRFRRRGGPWAWVEAHASSLPAAEVAGVDGDSPSDAAPPASAARIVVTVRDISGRYRLEAEQAQALELFELSFAAAPIGKALVAPDGRLLKVNQSFCELLARSEEQLLAATFQQITHPEDLAADEGLLAETSAGARDGYRLEKRYLRPDGAVVWGMLAVSVVRRPGGAPRFFIAQVEDITERKTAMLEMERLATTDTLTGLPNRLLLMDRLRHALALARRNGGLVGVLFIDLDGFKPVNDTLGHDAGDELLRHVGRRLQGLARESDTTTRLGGDEFVVVCEQINTIDELALVGRRIGAALRQPFLVFGRDVVVTASIGVTAGRSGSAEELLREADRAMYAAKRERWTRPDPDEFVNVYGEALEAMAHDQLGLHAELGDGLARGELVVHYQPVVEMGSARTVAREALVRWQHPTYGLLPPSAFIDGIDRSHLGVALGEHVLTRACADAASWPEDLTVHVNISARHLAQPGFPNFVRTCLRSVGLAPHRLVIEITESLVLAASPSTLTSAAALTDLGVGLCLDDFGTGYSSLAALNRIPIDSFKIDRSFIADAGDHPVSTALVEGLIGLGRHLDLDVIAEGVETAEQAGWLTERGCPHAQGFYFGAPEPNV